MPASDSRPRAHDPHPCTGDVYAEGAAGPPTSPEDGSDFVPDPRRGRILAVLLASLFMALVAVSIINVALPAIQRDLGASSSDLQWVLSGYALSFGVVLVAAGRAGDLFGRERLFVAGMALFTLASLAAALSPSPLLLNPVLPYPGATLPETLVTATALQTCLDEKKYDPKHVALLAKSDIVEQITRIRTLLEQVEAKMIGEHTRPGHSRADEWQRQPP